MHTLYLVGTPIGNLEDVTLRALRVLREVTLIAAEDTRRTRVLLTRYDIRTPTTSFHEGNRARQVPRLLARLESEDVALVTEAGMPGISDPGFELARAARERGAEVVVVPGPSAVTAAVVASGLPSDRFLFLGFLPRKSPERRRACGPSPGRRGRWWSSRRRGGCRARCGTCWTRWATATSPCAGR